MDSEKKKIEEKIEEARESAGDWGYDAAGESQPGSVSTESVVDETISMGATTATYEGAAEALQKTEAADGEGA